MRLLPESAQLHGGSAGLAEPVGDLAARREDRARARADAIFAAYGAEVERVCRGLLRNAADAEDAKQQTFLSAYRALLGGTEPRDVPAWLATIARHECYRQSAARKQAAVPALEIEEAPDLADVHTQAVANLSAARLRREIRRLPSLQRDAIVLREFAGLSYDELARELGVTRPAAHSLLVRARTTLRGRLRAEIAAVNFVAAIASIRRLLGHLGWRSGTGTVSVATKAAVITIAGTAVIGGGVVAERELTKPGHADAQAALAATPAAIGSPRAVGAAYVRHAALTHRAAAHRAAHVAHVAGTAAVAGTTLNAGRRAASAGAGGTAATAPATAAGAPLTPPTATPTSATGETPTASRDTGAATAGSHETETVASDHAATTAEGDSTPRAPASAGNAPATDPPASGRSTSSPPSGGSTSTPPGASRAERQVRRAAAAAAATPSTRRRPARPRSSRASRFRSASPRRSRPVGRFRRVRRRRSRPRTQPGRESTSIGTSQQTATAARLRPCRRARRRSRRPTTRAQGAPPGPGEEAGSDDRPRPAPGQAKKLDDPAATTTTTREHSVRGRLLVDDRSRLDADRRPDSESGRRPGPEPEQRHGTATPTGTATPAGTRNGNGNANGSGNANGNGNGNGHGHDGGN